MNDQIFNWLNDYYMITDPEMDASQRINLLQDKLRDLRQTYSALKAQVVLIDRRRKKLKRKEKGASFWRLHPTTLSQPTLAVILTWIWQVTLKVLFISNRFEYATWFVWLTVYWHPRRLLYMMHFQS